MVEVACVLTNHTRPTHTLDPYTHYTCNANPFLTCDRESSTK